MKFFLDTNSLIALAGLKGRDLEHFRSQLETDMIELCISHVQIDEKYTKEFPSFRKKIDAALRTFKENGITISPLIPTLGIVVGIWRVGYGRATDEETIGVDNDLRRELTKCMGKKARNMNIARDALIALSSLDCDYFITSDRCLHKSWVKTIKKNPENRRILEKSQKIPEIIYVRPVSQMHA